MFQVQIKKLRQSLGISQAVFGSRLGVTKQCISNWEKGTIRPSIDTLTRIAEVYHVSTDVLLGITELSPHMIDASGLSDTQIQHIELIISDFRACTSKE